MSSIQHKILKKDDEITQLIQKICQRELVEGLEKTKEEVSELATVIASHERNGNPDVQKIDLKREQFINKAMSGSDEETKVEERPKMNTQDIYDEIETILNHVVECRSKPLYSQWCLDEVHNVMERLTKSGSPEVLADLPVPTENSISESIGVLDGIIDKLQILLRKLTVDEENIDKSVKPIQYRHSGELLSCKELPTSNPGSEKDSDEEMRILLRDVEE